VNLGDPDRPFGAANREALLAEYFAGVDDLAAENVWQHVYRLLLWTDATTGLAHCYESDKAQPGRVWYARSLAFHAWLAKALGSTPASLPDELDWLFRRAIEQLAVGAAKRHAQRRELVAAQREPYEGAPFPLPGEDPELEALIVGELEPWLTGPPAPEALRRLTQRIRLHLSQENKRRNLLGEGFEDTLAGLVRRLPGSEGLDVRTRVTLHDLPGFRPPPRNEKARTVDLAVFGTTRRVLVTAKWSVRADREEQFGVDFDAYTRLDETGRDFEYVLVTNEFDAARLGAACERRAPGRALFASVVHVNPDGPLAAYSGEGRGAARALAGYIADGRLASLGVWLSRLTN
jgi:hypothetical protein